MRSTLLSEHIDEFKYIHSHICINFIFKEIKMEHLKSKIKFYFFLLTLKQNVQSGTILLFPRKQIGID